MHRLGETRSAHRRDHLLQTPDTFVRTPLPCFERGLAVVHAGPALGAAFTQYTAEFEAGSRLSSIGLQRFVYVLEGELLFESPSGLQPLTTGGFAYVPPEVTHSFSASAPARAAVIERSYVPLAGNNNGRMPTVLTGHEAETSGAPLMGDEDLQVRTLLPGGPEFDFAVNTMTYQPGASLPMVEVHVMEHGLLMLEGGGIYRLGDSWYPVSAGDFIWMGPYCPQWFGAIGKTPAKYLIYKDWNRHPIG